MSDREGEGAQQIHSPPPASPAADYKPNRLRGMKWKYRGANKSRHGGICWSVEELWLRISVGLGQFSASVSVFSRASQKAATDTRLLIELQMQLQHTRVALNSALFPVSPSIPVSVIHPALLWLWLVL